MLLSEVSNTLSPVAIVTLNLNNFLVFKFELSYSNDYLYEILYLCISKALRPKGHKISCVLGYSHIHKALFPVISRIDN